MQCCPHHTPHVPADVFCLLPFVGPWALGLGSRVFGSSWPISGSCPLLAMGPAMTQARFSLGVLVTSAACHIVTTSGPRGPCGWSGRSPRHTAVPCLPLGRLAASAGRAGGSCFFLIPSPSPQSLHSRKGDDLVALPHGLHEAILPRSI